MAVFKTIQFLPEVFKTDTNRKFLNATVDQLLSEPKLKKITGYIGRRLSPSYKSTDSYISEPSTDRQSYQLEPSLVIKNSVTNNIDFVTTYPDIINQIKYYGGLTDKHDRLFDGEYYSFDPKIDLDKFINFSQYYWLENGPESVIISSSNIPLQKSFDVTYDSVSETYRFSLTGSIPNPIITLARGGTYTFNISDVGNNFYIQSKPGQDGTDSSLPNINTRNVLGVSNNGIDSGIVSFTVPSSTAQAQWTSMSIAATVDFATNIGYSELQGMKLSELNDVYGGLDGITTSIDQKFIVFVNQEKIDDLFWEEVSPTIVNDVVSFTSTGNVIPLTQKNDVYSVRILKDSNGDDRIVLTRVVSVENEQKIQIRSGLLYAGKEFYCRSELLREVPLITAPLDTLYYQNSSTGSAVGILKIVDIDSSAIDPAVDIIGKPNYTSPSGVIFTNGLKITFDSTVSETYKNKTYYVEGVGSSIRLILTSSLISPELDNNLSYQDYFTINRSSLDQNAWSRSNRWFHMDIIQKAADYNGTIALFDQNLRAKRPIIEFNADLQLFNYGTEAKLAVDTIDTFVTNAYTQIQGVVCASNENHTFVINGKNVTLVSGTRVIFTNDVDNNVRNKIYNFSIEKVQDVPDPIIYRAYIEEAFDSLVLPNNTVVVNMNNNLSALIGTENANNNKKQWFYNGEMWQECQQKTKINQEPLFDIVDNNGLSFSNPAAYSGSTFYGTKIFSYQRGNGDNDPILGIPLSYRNFSTQGDIQFYNYFDNADFTYLDSSGVIQTIKINSGLLQKNITRSKSIRQNIWTIVEHFSKQFQTYSFTYDGTSNIFPIDNLPDLSLITPNIKVFVNNQQILNTNFATVSIVDRLAVSINQNILSNGDSVFVNIYSTETSSPNAFYEVPINLDINSLNANLNSLTLGQVRNHLISLKNNSLNVVGDVPGSSNLRDIQITNNGGSILQHSTPVVYSGLFLTHPITNFINAIKFANNEYVKFKTKFLELSTNLDLDRNDISGSVDAILGIINDIKNDSFPWVYSDMVPYAAMSPVELPTYTVINPELKSYEITSIFQDKKLNRKAVFVYLTREIDNVSVKTLLVKDRDFIFEQDRPAITFLSSFTLLYGDQINIVEYDDTTGSYVPETPTKLGMYPKFIPEIYVDNTYRTPRIVIQGHDGSITPAFGDYRDHFLLELERRIYNNIKIDYDLNLFNIDDYLPGKFRITSYDRQEFNQILSQGFLSWVGTNRVDYTTNNIFNSSDPFTWNYKKFRDNVNGESLPGTWRAVFKYFYDTDRPHTHPWEMLGFSIKPDWWEDRYGPAPYTGGNSILWSDLSLGYIHAGDRAGFDIRYQRPNLAQFVPVDDSGNLRPPSEILVSNYDSTNGNTSYAVGDFGPAETAWRRSSEYPFMLQLALALAKPARYFSLLSNVTNYKRDPITAQFLVVDNQQHITPTSILINGYNNGGTIQQSVGYINYIRDYVKSLGIADAELAIKNNLTELSVQLTYKMAGFTDKKFINLLAEQSSPSSINDSIVIPDENYRLELFKGSPLNKIVYSAVIVEKSDSGWTVSGFDTANPYFFIIPSLPNNNAYVVTSGSERAVIYKDYQSFKVTIPYGFEFNTIQQVADFLVSYQRYLIAQGFVFTDIDTTLKEQKDWILSVKEFLHWYQQGWKTGSLIVLSPVSTELKVYDSESVIDEITNTPYGNKVVDVNNQIIKKNDFTVLRENNLFTFKSNSNQTIALAELTLVQFEHLLVLDNQTSFRDVIYLPELGNRQYRLKIVGSKTDNWNGSLELPGFIYSSSTVPEWNPGTDYLKGSIVKNKSQYYTALQNITAADKFQTNFWKQISASELRSGMINNFATNASQSINFYDIDNQPLDENIQLFSDGLIGFRNRDYFDNLGLDYTTQSKFYQGMIQQKGTSVALNALQGAKFNNINTNVNIYENWAMRVGEYGALDSNKIVEVILDEDKVSFNPTAIQFIDDTVTAEPDIISYTKFDAYKITDNWTAKIFRTEDLNISPQLKPLPVAGFVNPSDVDATIFSLEEYATLTTIVDSVGDGYKIWTARNFNKEWDVLRSYSLDGTTFSLIYTVDNLIQIQHSDSHGLLEGELVVLKNFDTRFNGVYRVVQIVDSTTFTVELYQNLQTMIEAQIALGTGLLFVLRSVKLNYPYLVNSVEPKRGWLNNDKIWVKNLDLNGNWGVYNKVDSWKYQTSLLLEDSGYTTNTYFGETVTISPDGFYLYASAPGSNKISVHKKNNFGEWDRFSTAWANGTDMSGFGNALAASNQFLIVASPKSSSRTGYVYIFKDQVLMQILANENGNANDLFGYSVAMSDDARFLYIGSPGSDEVFCYGLNLNRSEFSVSFTGDGYRDTFAIDSPTDFATDVIVTFPLRSSEKIPYIDYTLNQFTDGIKIINSSFYDTTTQYYTLAAGGTAVDPFPIASSTNYQVAATGGTGSGALFNVLRTSGSTTYQVQIVNPGENYTIGDSLTILGSLVGGADGVNNITIDITEVYTSASVVFNSVIDPLERVSIVKRNYFYKLIETLPKGVESLGTNDFGYSVSCNSDGSVIVVGAPRENTNEYNNTGASYVYHKTVSEFITNGITGTFNLPNAFNSIRQVTLDGQVLVENTDYSIVGNSVQFDAFYTPAKSKKLVVETNQFIFDQKLLCEQGENFMAGSKIAMCGTGCNIFIASDGYHEGNYNTGSVTRFLNVGRVYGKITGTVENPTVNINDSIIINNKTIYFTGTTLNTVIININSAGIAGVTASKKNNKLVISSTSNEIGNKLNILRDTGSAFEDLGIQLYVSGQVIYHNETTPQNFAKELSVNANSTTLAIASDGATITRDTTFDNLTTTLDSNSTRVSEVIKDAGAIYIYDLMESPFETQESPSFFAFTNKLSSPNIFSGYNYGSSVSISRSTIAVGVSHDDTIVDNGGSVFVYSNPELDSGWVLIRQKEPRVDIGAINTSFIYNNNSQLLINYFDYIDPAKGKILGVAEQALDYLEDFDPAVYNVGTKSGTIQNSSFYWTNLQVGKTWWDLSQVSFIYYEQGPLSYRLKNWGNLFPGAQVKVYEWVESNVPPSQYVAKGGDGTPKYDDDSSYSIVSTVDSNTGIINQKYYFWVSGKVLVDPVKTNRLISTTVIEQYINNPRDQNIPFIAPLSPNGLGLFNVNNLLSGQNVTLSLNLSNIRDSNIIHNEYELIQEGNPTQQFPEIILTKLRDSLAGFDSQGSTVPDYLLTDQDKIGLSRRPRQSLFVNRIKALKNYINSLNLVLIKNPILLISTPTTLYSEDPVPTSGFDAILNSQAEFSYIDTTTFPSGYTILIPVDTEYNNRWSLWSFNGITKEFNLITIQSYKTTLYWTPIDWYSSDFVQGTKIDYIVQDYGKIQTLTLNAGNYIKVLDNGNGQWLIYYVEFDGTLSLQAAQNATLKLNESIYSVDTGTGYDASVFDLIDFDPTIGQEFVNIFNAVYQEILIKDLAIEFNQLFFDMVNYIFSEQKSPNWIFKTSFIDVYHNIRNLEKIPTYIQDNQTFYRDYINEVKPYRTKIKDYIPVYNGSDNLVGEWSDFDIPGAYDPNSGTYRSLNVSNQTDEYILSTTEPYTSWYNNYKYKVADYIIENPGTGYTTVPDIKIVGGGGTGATANCTINLSTGKITSVLVSTPGKNYTSTPEIIINGTGSGAKVYPILKNEYYLPNENLSYNTVRNIKTNINFDRFAYTSNVIQWQPNVSYPETVISTGNLTLDSGNIWISGGNILVYNNQAFLATANAVTPGANNVFDYTKFKILDEGNVLLNATDRISIYYQPDISMPGKNPKDLMYGVDYPGIKVDSPEFTACSFSITSNVVYFDYTGLRIVSGNVNIVDFQNLGFYIDQPIRIQSLVPFDFVNNGYYKIISVTHDEMTLTGSPIESTYNLTISTELTANVGDVITQANSTANAYVLANVINSRTIPIVYNTYQFGLGSNVISINGIITTAYPQEIVVGGQVNTTISYLELDTSVLDSNIYSKYIDTSLGTRPEDINIVGGAYVDTYSSHAPEELVPGRMFDALEIKVFSNTIGNTATYGFRIFEPMSANVEYRRISANNTTTLAANISVADTKIYLTDSTVLPYANPTQNIPGVVFINGEKIHYYQKYDISDIAGALTWTANTSFLTGTLVNVSSNTYLVVGNVYANSSSYINSSNIQLVEQNTLTQIRRGVDGTGIANVHISGSKVVDSSIQQSIPDNELTIKTYTGNIVATSNVSWRLNLSSNITANIGDYITQFVGNTGNARVLDSIVSANVVAVEFVSGNILLASNVGTRVNIANLTSYTTTTANVLSMTPLGMVKANGNVVLSSVAIYNSNVWVPMGTGVGLEGSTTLAAEFIKDEQSYIP